MYAEWPEMVADAIEIRHDLHRRPEIAWAEFDTVRTVRQLLTDWRISQRPCAGTGLIAQFAPDADGRHIALRADLDAMPIVEDTDLGYASQRPGLMHACGHDGHTATLLVVARWMAAHEAELPGPVTLLFQPAEEGGHGAREMIDDGALAGVDVVFGWHNWPGLPVGRAICPDGPVMAANGTFEVRLTGRGGHASQPEATRDPVLAAAAAVVALQQVVARRLAPHTAAVVAVTWIAADSAPTVTPDVAALGGSVRVGSTADRDRVFELIADVAHGIAAAHGVEATVEVTARYGTTVNHPSAAADYRRTLAGRLGEDWARHDGFAPVMASEDFSYYLQQIPGAFALIGAGTDAAPLHNAQYDFNDDLIDPVARLMVDLAGAPAPD
ncbi:amidohydrolase [Gordonia sp. TBRC 11910]|uniref:Amidohydrolase n=1 Tax=Gordonia asplenii TaxID=2725283 RepID=A0A848KP19_9ACTN|nr:N(2)-acetyl-L-2,4-diaminobutanoate deacetylase DoeB2 [Gordonia asplenii]NMN99646.1 amidohydrolase [Gordonia asplenii]